MEYKNKEKSKWGIEEKETIKILDRIRLKGEILNLAAGDGRFNTRLLNMADKVTSVDINVGELKELEKSCPNNLKSKLSIKCMDITKRFLFEENTFDAVFCTGTLHLFNIETIEFILNEMKRVLKKNGKILLNFATDISRLDCNGNPVIFEKEGNYTMEEAIKFFKNKFTDFSINIEKATFAEEQLEEGAGYQSISGNFLIISGESRIQMLETQER